MAKESFYARYRLVFGPAFILLGLYMSMTQAPFYIGTAVMAAGFVYLIRGIMARKHGEGYMKGDERTRKIGAFAAAYSWFFTIIAISVLFWLDRFLIAPMSAQQALGAVLLFMVATLILSRWHIARKGDVPSGN